MLLQEIAEHSKVLLIKEYCEVKGELENMNLFSRLKKSDGHSLDENEIRDYMKEVITKIITKKSEK